MRNKLLFITILFFSFSVFAQDLTGSWSGIIISGNQNPKTADVIYLKIEGGNDQLTGLTRIELLDDKEFAVKSFEAKQDGNTIILSEKYGRRSSNSRNSPICKLDYTLEYDDSLAYLKGTYASTDCRHNRGEVVFFRSTHDVNMEKEPESTHLWKHRFVKSYLKGYPAPEVMKKLQQEFEFQPIYFDHDESDIKPEFFEYLKEMAMVLDGIHDLRVKITGHTDAVGTDEYNIGLSERRAKSIRDHFKKLGVEAEKLEIDFKGKRQPIETNKTAEGKQRNRRVNFKFI